jgi:MOSC domain-containing protein YiiM
MPQGRLLGIAISPAAKGPMQALTDIEAVRGRGLAGDRYAKGEGSYNKGALGKRQVTLINAKYVTNSGFEFLQTRRNLLVAGIELNDQIGHYFSIGSVIFNGVKYCDPCMIPTKLSGSLLSFRDVFHDCGGLVAEVIEGGILRVGAAVTTRTKDY